MSANTANTKIKRVVVLCGSPRKQGFSAQMLNQLLSGTDCDVTRFDAYELAAAPCVACGYCEAERGCCNPDLDAFFGAYDAADIVVIASPIYFGGFPAPMKAVIDRVQRFYSERFALHLRPMSDRPKKAALLLSGGNTCERSCDYLTNEIRQMFTVLNTTLCGSYCLSGTDNGGDIDLLKIAQIKEAIFGSRA